MFPKHHRSNWLGKLFLYGFGILAFASLFKVPSHGLLIGIIILIYWKLKRH